MKFNLTVLFFFLLCVIYSADGRGMMVRRGGFGNTQPATEDEQAILDTVRKSVETQLDHHFPKFEAVSYTTQVVAGINYVMVVDTGEETYLHVKVGKPLPYRKEDPFLMSVRQGVTLTTPIDPALM